MDEAEPLGAMEGARLQSKESEYSRRPEGRNMLESQEMFITGEGDYNRSPPQEFAVQEGKNLRSINHGKGLEQPHANRFSMDETGITVEELRVTNYNGSNVAIVGTSSNRERMQARQNQWQHLYQLAGGSGGVNSRGDTMNKDNGHAISSFWEDIGGMPFPELLAQKPFGGDNKDMTEHITSAENRDASVHNGVIRTKIISKSGFSEFFVKKTLKGKGIVCKGPFRDVFHDGTRDQSALKIGPRDQNILKIGTKDQNTLKIGTRDQNTLKIGTSAMVASDISPGLGSKTALPSLGVAGFKAPGGSDHDGVGLRQWLKVGHRKASKVECLYIFRQIVGVVDHFHSQGIALKELRPSCFRLLPSNQVKYIGSPIEREALNSIGDQNALNSDNSLIRKRPLEQVTFPSAALYAKKQKFGESANFIRRWHQLPPRSCQKLETTYDSSNSNTYPRDSCEVYNEANPSRECEIQSKPSSPCASTIAHQQLISLSDQLEEKWYRSPEELNEGGCTPSSNIYCLGVLIFEFLGRFDSERARAAAMSDLRHRILPPNFLSENPKEAGFCLWLIHPDPSSRPTTREILQSEVLSGGVEVFPEELSSSIDQDDADSDLLLHFLVSLEEEKNQRASKLVEEINCLEADIGEVEKRRTLNNSLMHSCLQNGSPSCKETLLDHREVSALDVLSPSFPISNTTDLRLTRNIHQLEKAYFSVRSEIQVTESGATTRTGMDLLRNREKLHPAQKVEEKPIPTDRLGAFFDGLCKYARYSKFEVRGILRNGDFNNSANVICSLSFDRDEEYFAAAGVSKKIKIFEFNAFFNESVDIHYPAVEISNKSKLSCVCWNNYIKNYLASTDYDGLVKLWDSSTGQEFSQFTEHEKRAWSVDFSQVSPTKLASGSDDCSVKLWSINEKNSLDTIKNIANVCCVQFSAHSSHLLAFGSADYRTYCYDLRFTKIPWCVLDGHDKAVSYVKFLDSETLVSASTDNTLKLWDLKKTSPCGLSKNACSLTLSGHANEKNFVGLSTADGYIACGSETNEVFTYYRSLPMPITSHKFGSIDPISGKETADDNMQFVSSVCWRGKSDMVVAANSSGCIKVLQLV